MASATYAMLGITMEQAQILELGEGQFGVVFRHGTDRALKLPRLFQVSENDPEHMRIRAANVNPGNAENMAYEVTALQALGDHPSLVKIYSCDAKRGIEMELLEGGNLQAHVGELPEPDFSQRLRWALQVADGVHYMHGRGILHNDLSCRNVMFDKLSHAKIIDFSNADVEPEEGSREGEKMESVATDVCDFSSIMYSLMTWKVYRFDIQWHLHPGCFPGETRPPRRGWPTQADLPPVDDIPHGDFIMNCWLRKYDNMETVCSELRRIIQQHQQLSKSPQTQTIGLLSVVLKTVSGWLLCGYSIMQKVWWHLWTRFRQ